MNEKLISLAKLLATDDAFSSNFSSKVIDEEKYELAKTKFSDLTREDFSKFLKKLYEEENKLNELSPVELQAVAGGINVGSVTKLAAVALFVSAMGLTGAMSQQTNADIEQFYDTAIPTIESPNPSKILPPSNTTVNDGILKWLETLKRICESNYDGQHVESVWGPFDYRRYYTSFHYNYGIYDWLDTLKGDICESDYSGQPLEKRGRFMSSSDKHSSFPQAKQQDLSESGRSKFISDEYLLPLQARKQYLPEVRTFISTIKALLKEAVKRACTAKGDATFESVKSELLQAVDPLISYFKNIVYGSDFKFESFYKSHTKEQLRLALMANGLYERAQGKDTDHKVDRDFELDRFSVILNGYGHEGRKTIRLTLSGFQHIFVGDTKESSSSGEFDYGHTKYAVAAAKATAKERTKAIREKELVETYKKLTRYEPEEYKLTFSVLSNGKKTGVKKIRFYLDKTGSTVKSIFPEDWGWKEIKEAAILCLENGTLIGKNENYRTYALKKGSPGYDFDIVTVVDVSNNRLITCYPKIL